MTALTERRLPQPHLVHGAAVSRETAPSPVEPPAGIPSWAQIAEDITKTGQVASQAIAVDFERAAKEIETLGIELLGIAKEHDAMMDRLKIAIDEVRETAKRYREHGAGLLHEIQLSSRKIAAIHEHAIQLKASLTDIDIDAEKI